MAKGAAVPAFASANIAPTALVLTGTVPPLFLDDDTAHIADPAKDLVLMWVPVEADVFFRLEAQGPGQNGQPLNLVCMVDSMAGGLTIPAAVLGRLDMASYLELYTIRRSMLSAGDYDVTLSVATSVNDAQGNWIRFKTALPPGG
jgi:hypothetical protein